MCRQRNTTSVTIDTTNSLQKGSNSQDSELESGALLGDRINSCRTSGGFLTGG